jgi:hypothetical protein
MSDHDHAASRRPDLDHDHDRGHGRGADHAPASASSASRLVQLRRARNVMRRGVSLPGGIAPKLIHGEAGEVLAMLDRASRRMVSDAYVPRWDQTPAGRQIKATLSDVMFAQKEIAIDYKNEEGMNMRWEGNVAFTFEKPVPARDAMGKEIKGIGENTTVGGGFVIGSSGTKTTDTGTIGGTAGQTPSGATGGPGASATASSSTARETNSQDTTQVNAGTSQRTIENMQWFSAGIIATVNLRVKVDMSDDSDKVNPFKWGAALANMVHAPSAKDECSAGRFVYQMPLGLAPPGTLGPGVAPPPGAPAAAAPAPPASAPPANAPPVPSQNAAQGGK